MQEAQVFLATLSAIMQGIQTWLSFGDARAAKNNYEIEFNRINELPGIQDRAENFQLFIPKDLIERLTSNISECYKKLSDMLDDEDAYFPADIDKAAEIALPACICRNIKRILDVTGGRFIDELVEEAWISYNCDSRYNRNPILSTRIF